MAQITGKYQLEKNVNFLQLLVKSGVPEDQAKQFDAVKYVLDVKVSGDKITVQAAEQTNEYIVGKEVEEHVFGKKQKALAKLSGSVLTVESKDDSGKSAKRVYTFKDSGAEEVITSSDGVEAKRIFKRL